MNFKTTILLVVLLLVLGGVYIFAPWGTEDTNEQTMMPTTSAYLRGDQSADVELSRFEIKKFEADPIVCERVGEDSWRLTSPIEAAADRYQVESVAKTLWNLKAQSSFASDSRDAISAADAGLESPRLVVTITPKAGTPLVLEVGKPVLLSDATYVRLQGQSTIHTVAYDFKKLLDRTEASFRSREIMAFGVRDVSQLAIRVGDMQYDLASDASNVWRMSSPVASRAVKDAVRDYLVQLVGIESLGFVGTEAGKLNMGFDDPGITIKVGAKGLVQTLIIGGAADLEETKYFAKLAEDPSVFLLSRDDLKRLTPSLSKLRDSRLTGFDVASVEKITLTHGDKAETFAIEEARWVGQGDLRDLSIRDVLKLVRTIAELRGTQFVDQPEDMATYGLDSPRATVTVWTTSQEMPVTIEIGDPTDDKRNVYARIRGENIVALIGIQPAGIMACPPMMFRSRRLLDLNPTTVTEIKLARDGQERKIVKNGAVWQLAEPTGAPLSMPKAWAMAVNLSSLVADSVVARNADAEYGLEPPAATINIKGGTDSADTQTLFIGFVAGRMYARRSDDSIIFELDATVRDDLVGELIDPKVFAFGPDAIVEYEYTLNRRNFHLVQKDGVWQVPEFPELALKSDPLIELLKAVANLRASWYVSYDKADLALLNKKQNSRTSAEVKITLQSGDVATLSIVSVDRPGVVLACWHEGKKTFWLDEADAKLLVRGLDHYIQSADISAE